MSSDSTFSSFDHIGASHDSDTVRPNACGVPTVIFGSQGGDFIAAYDIIIALSFQQPELAAFLSLALDAVRGQLQSVARRKNNAIVVDQPEAERVYGIEADLLALLPPFEAFSDLRTLVDFHRRTCLRDPIINGVLLCLIHTASVVAVYCAARQSEDRAPPAQSARLREAWKTISQPRAHVLGFCTGALSAFAIRQLVEGGTASSAFNLWMYVHEAVKSVSTSFWIGLRSAQARLRLANADGPATSLGHWSVVVVFKEAERVEEFYNHLSHFDELEQRRPLSRHIPIAVTARAMGQISLGGPPQVLDRFMAYLVEKMGAGCRVSPLEIFSPYHSMELRGEAELVMIDIDAQGLVDDSLLAPSQKILWDTGNASILSETITLREAFHRIVGSNLCFTADWDRMIDSLVSFARESSDAAKQGCSAIVSFGPGTALATDLKKRISCHHGCSLPPDDIKLFDVPSLLRDWSATTITSGPKLLRLLQPDVHGEDVVIVSMACRFPGNVRTPEQLWTCLETGRSTVAEIPKHLFDINAYYGDGLNQTLARHMHALPENVTKSMDARLFSMSPKEIEQLDPQHRLVMLCSYEALERAGFSSEANSPSSFDGKRIAVCMGASWDDYRENASWNIGSYFITGNIRAFIPGHVSFALKWEGPSVSVDSLECSAVSAIQWSRRALLSGQCDVALAGAVNVLTQPQMFIAMDKEGILSRTGTNATFSKKLDGKTRGDGCGVLLLKRRSTAIQDGDKILATLPAARTTFHGLSLSHHDISAHQSEFLAQVMSEAGTHPSELVHIEASGFHTQQGEAAEIESFARLFTQSKVRTTAAPDDGVSVTSSRPNVGAGEAVSAMASVMKAVLMFENGSVPRQMSISATSELQTAIATTLASSPLFVPTQSKLLSTQSSFQGRRTILVNSLASTDCQGVVLVGAPTTDEAASPGNYYAYESPLSNEKQAWLFALSAKTKESGEMTRKSLIDYLQEREVCLPNLSYSLLCRRTHHPFCLSVVAAEQDELIQVLRNAEFIEAKTPTDLPKFGLFFQRPRQISRKSTGRLFTAILGLQRHYNELIAALKPQNSTEADRQAELLQICLASLLQDCGVLPSVVAGNMIPMLLSGKWLDKQSALMALCDFRFSKGESPLGHIIQKGSADLLTLEGELVQCSTSLPLTDVLLNKLTAERSEEASGEEPSGLPSAFRWILINDSVEIVNYTTEDAETQRLSFDGEQNLQRRLLQSLGRLHQEGYMIRWIEYFRPYLSQLRFIEKLPTYPFHFQQYWMEYHDRNLLHRDAPVAGEAPGAALGEAPDIIPDDPLVQPLLTGQISGDNGSRVYTCDLTGEAQVALLKASVPSALSVELMVEAILESCGSPNRKVWLDDGQLLCVSCLQLSGAGRSLLHLSSIRLIVKSLSLNQSRGDHLVEMQCDGDSPVIGNCTHMSLGGNLDHRWSRLQTVFGEQIRSLKIDGELLNARLIYKGIRGDLSTSTNSIRSAYAKTQTQDVLFCNRMPHHDTSLLREGHCTLALLLSTVEECARWYASVFAPDAEAEYALIAVDELIIRGGWLESLGKQTGSTREYTVFVTPVQKGDQRTPLTDEILIDVLLLNNESQVVGTLDWVRLAKVKSAPKNPIRNPTSSAAATTANDSKLVPPTAREAQGPPPGAQKRSRDMPTSLAATVHQRIRNVLASELGIAVEEMKPKVKFADLGLDSLMSLVCISTLESLDLGFEIPQSLFMECDSSEELLAWVREQVGDEEVEEDPDPPLERVDIATSTVGIGALNPVVHTGSATNPNLNVQAACQTAKPGPSIEVVEDAMKRISSTVETELGVAEGSIDEGAILADLGMDSLMSLLVLGNLSGLLPIELPSSLFMDCTSLREIRDFLAAELGDSSETAHPEAATVETQTHNVTDQQSARASVFTIPPSKKPVLLRKGTDQACVTPLFLLPDGSGMSNVYQFFPAIERDIYSINSPFLADASAWNGGIAQITQYYLASIKLIQPKGPWLVGGWSFGGMAAFEIARTLVTSSSTAGDKVAGLFLLDSPCPALYPPLPMSIVDWIFTAPEVRDIAPPALSKKLVEHFKATVDSLVDWRPSSMVHGDPEKIPKVWYVVADHPLPGRAQDIREANESVKWLFRSNRAAINGTDGWETYIPSTRINVIPVAEANHFTLVRAQASKVASILQEACRSALQS